MKVVSVAPYDTPTYDSFRREVDGFIAQIKVMNLSQAQLRTMLDAAVENWRARAFPKSWIMRARVEALKEMAGTLLDNRRRRAGIKLSDRPLASDIGRRPVFPQPPE